MKNDFEFDIPNERKKQIRLFENLILLLNGLAFIFFGLKTNNTIATISGLIILVLTLVSFFIKNDKYNIAFAAAMACFGSWIKIGYWWIGLFFFLLSILGGIVSLDKKIKFNSRQIQISTPFPKIFKWFELQNVILKDGLLTLDFKNNKLLQTSILDELNEAETKQFNDFCQERLKAEGLGQKA
jgi:hypothetical protein